MQVHHKQFVLHHSDTKLVLLPSKLVWWPDERTLFMADSHFGKASSFRKAGLPVPRGTTSRMLAVLSEQVLLQGAETLTILGDFIHSAVPAIEDFEQELKEWRQYHASLRIRLIKGNHDRRSKSFYEGLDIETSNAKSVQTGPFELCHAPDDASGTHFSLSGHLHPAFMLQSLTLPCFWIRRDQMILPAFGEFTGSAKIRLSPNESAVVICDDSLAVVSQT